MKTEKLLIGTYNFSAVCEIQPVQEKDGEIKQFMPQNRYKNTQRWQLNKYGVGPFCKFTIPTSLNVSGVYAITNDDNILYIGECQNLSSRFNAGYGNISPRNCFMNGQETNCRLNNLIFKATSCGQRTSLWFFQTVNFKAMEIELRSSLILPWNRR